MCLTVVTSAIFFLLWITISICSNFYCNNVDNNASNSVQGSFKKGIRQSNGKNKQCNQTKKIPVFRTSVFLYVPNVAGLYSELEKKTQIKKENLYFFFAFLRLKVKKNPERHFEEV